MGEQIGRAVQESAGARALAISALVGAVAINFGALAGAHGRTPRPGRYRGYVAFPDNSASFKDLRMRVARRRRVLRNFSATHVQVNCATSEIHARFRFVRVPIRRSGKFKASLVTPLGRQELTGRIRGGTAAGTLKFRTPDCFSSYVWYAHHV